MPSYVRRTIMAGVLMLAAATFGFAQSSQPAATSSPASTGTSSTTQFGLDMTIGVQTYPNPAYPSSGSPTIAYQSIGLKPDLSFGKFGIGLDLTFNYTFTAGAAGNEFQVRSQDWIPDSTTSFLELYLPKIRYVRWDHKGAPLYILLGQVDNAVLGNGFIVGGYSNTQWLPSRRLFGMSFDLDGALFGFPYVGIETFTSNLAALDLLGARLYVRPLAFLKMPILPGLQIGSSLVTDQNPFYFAQRDPNTQDPYSLLGTSPTAIPANPQVYIWGVDSRLPILSSPIIDLALFGDFVKQKIAQGGMVGAGGKLAGFINYGAQIRFIGDNFIPDYFGSTYDLYRLQEYSVYTGTNYTGSSTASVTLPGYTGWFGSLGFSMLDDKLSLNVSMDGAFNADYSNPVSSTFAYPHLHAEFLLKQGLLPGFGIAATYDKIGIQNFAALISPENAVIGARLDYKTGPAVISLVYNLAYNQYSTSGNPWTITSRLETSISLF